MNILLTELSQTVRENLEFIHVYRLNADNFGQDSPIQTSCSVNKSK